MTQTTHAAASHPAPARRAARTAPGQGDAYWFFGSRTVIRSPEGVLPVVIEMELAPGGHAPLHVHHDIDDSFYLQSGRIAVRCGDDVLVAQAGDYVCQPKGVPHTFFVLDDQPAVILQTHDGDSFLNFIKQAGVPATGPVPPVGDQPGMDWLYQVAAATGQPVTGPPMTPEEAAQILAAQSTQRRGLMTTTPLTRAFARRPGAGASRDYVGHLFSFLAESQQTASTFSVIEVTVRKGLEPPPHTHTREDETYYILEGGWSFEAGSKPFAAEPGTLVFLPRGVQHSFSIDRDAARALVLLTPGGLEGAFREMSEPTAQAHGLPPRPDGPPPIARMAEVFGARGIIFAPPPAAATP